MIVGGFAGIGMAEGMRPLGLIETGLELDPAACATRRAAGHPTIEGDITQQPTQPFQGAVGGAFAPPCPGFNKSGKKLGLRDLPLVHQAIDDLAHGRDTRQQIGAACLDERSILTAEPMRWLYDLRPEWFVMEQVPSVLPVWQQYAAILRDWGYSTAAGVFDAAWLGLPQNRRRALFAASRVRDVSLPEPTHGGIGQPPFIPMAKAVGWGYTQRPAPSVTGGGTYTGGAEPFGNGTRQAMRRAMGTPRWAARDLPHLRPTIAECARLQGFRPDLAFYGNAGHQHRQIGNAVAVPVVTALVAEAAGIRTEPAEVTP